jgi:hypothetical protein
VGNTTIECSAHDAANNSALCDFSIEVLDQIPPNITLCPASVTASTDLNSNSTNVFWNYSVYDNSGVVFVSFLDQDTNTDVSSGQLFAFGSHHIQMIATDPSSNVMTCNFLITVVDKQSPTIVGCPTNSTVFQNYTIFGYAYGIETVPSLSAYDNVAMQFTQYIGVQAQYSIGTTSVTFLAVDSSGNKAQCVMTVKIVDNQPPIITNCPNETLVCPTLKNSNAAPCSWPAINATDVVPAGLAGVYSSHPTGYTYGSSFPFGTTTMTYVVTDKESNSATCTFNVSIVDNQAPTFTFCPSSFTVSTNATGSIYAYVSWTNPVATDNVHLNSLSSSLSPGTYTVGIYNVTVNATDSSGNLAVCNFTFVVVVVCLV